MSKPDWTAMADRYGAQEAQYNGPRLAEDCATCGRHAGAEPCLGCLEDEARQADRFAAAFQGDCPPVCDLLTLSRAHQDAGAAQDGQASIALALGTWLALVIAFAVLALCVYGAAWADGAWLAPFAGLAR
ncbi:MAG: hypothetical protein ACTHMU_09690 [Thermomicrobiales bacterium]